MAANIELSLERARFASLAAVLAFATDGNRSVTSLEKARVITELASMTLDSALKKK